MGTVSSPGAGPTDLALLGEKVNGLGCRLEQLLSLRQCVACGACSVHAGQQEAMAAQLATQGRRLESLEKLVLGIHAALGLSGAGGGGADKRRLPTHDSGKKLVVQVGPEKDRVPSPIKVPVRETKEPLFHSGVKKNLPNAATLVRKGVLPQEKDRVEKMDDNGPVVGEACSQVQEEPKLTPTQISTHSLVPPQAPDSSKPTVLRELRDTPLQLDSDKMGLSPKCDTEREKPAEKQAGGCSSDASACETEKVTTAQTLNCQLSPPNTVAATAPWRRKSITIATGDGSSLRHVQSCPVSLQSSSHDRTSGSEMPPCHLAPPLVKTDTVAAGVPGPSNPSCIKIQLSPAVDGTTNQARLKSPPKTVCKMIDDDPPLPAPFPHRFVSLRPCRPCDSYSINTLAVLGGGRFGRVHRCTEKTSGLKLAAKTIAARNAKEKEMALNEIQVMNQLSHPNILQLYDAFEARHEVVLVLEYVEGGELFERIVDESSSLTEMDAMVFVKQICQGIHYMHQMYVLHLDLKPENILCVNCTGHQVKIIDFGLARRYKPREKLRVSFGTPEFLAPEIVNFDFVSFPTDMWTIGVVTYMLLSGMSPFLGDDDSQTLNNVLAVNWYFDEEAFEYVSAEAKDFVSNLLIREKSGRLSAAQCLKHPWLSNIPEKAGRNNVVLKSQVQLRKYMAKRLWKKNYIAIAAANRFKKISSSGSLTTLGV